MGDELVTEIMESETMDGVAFANGLTRHGPIIDLIVNQLREFGMSDDDIRSALVYDNATQPQEDAS